MIAINNCAKFTHTNFAFSHSSKILPPKKQNWCPMTNLNTDCFNPIVCDSAGQASVDIMISSHTSVKGKMSLSVKQSLLGRLRTLLKRMHLG